MAKEMHFSTPVSKLAIFILAWTVPSFGATAHFEISPKSGSKARGTAELTDTEQGLKMSYKFSGLRPNGVFGFHIHEKGDCSSSDGKSAGGHYIEIAPSGGTSVEFPEKFAGDLKEIRADDQGMASATIYIPHLTVEGENAVNDHAVVIHDGPDNPKKKSPPRIGCGVISKN